MTAMRSGLLAVALLSGVSGAADAQYVKGGFGQGGYGAYPGSGVSSGYYTTNGGFGSYGLPGTGPNYGGHALPGYGPGANLGGYFAPIRPNLAPQTTNNLGGLMNTIRMQTGAGTSYQYGASRGISRRRPR